MKKKIVSVCLVVCLLATAIIGTTLAYFTDDATVTNTFTVGEVTITMDETDVDIYGVKESDTRVTENKYKLIPGRDYIKDPTINVGASSEDCYLFVTIDNGLSDVIEELDLAGWTYVENGNYYYYIGTGDGVDTEGKAVSAGSKVPVFSGFTVLTTVDADGLKAVNGEQIVVNAYAVQADGFDTAQAAWDAAKGDLLPGGGV